MMSKEQINSPIKGCDHRLHNQEEEGQAHLDWAQFFIEFGNYCHHHGKQSSQESQKS
jgi:hypothetical protein